jgi:superfamily I DNA/RNA helicase
MGDEKFFSILDEIPTPLEERLIHAAATASLQQAWQGLIDFDDQILMPTVFNNASFPQYPLVMVDEAQDLSELNHAMLRKLARKRLIAVGDECQAIYAFRGANAESMQALESTFAMRRLTLTISFRCPQAIVREAQWRAPAMQPADGAAEGSVRTLNEWTVGDLPDTATILCRNNAPIFNQAIRLLRNGRYPQIVGNDVGRGLLRAMRKLGDERTPQAQVLTLIDAWEEGKLKRARSEARVRDQAECLRIFARQGSDLGEALAYAEQLLAAKGPIVLSTIHKAKGLEWPDVFLLDKDLIRLGEGQEDNLLYVAMTRSKENLTYVTTEGFR